MGGRSHRELWPGVSKTILSNGFYSPMFLRQDRDTTYHPARWVKSLWSVPQGGRTAVLAIPPAKKVRRSVCSA